MKRVLAIMAWCHYFQTILATEYFLKNKFDSYDREIDEWNKSRAGRVVIGVEVPEFSFFQCACFCRAASELVLLNTGLQKPVWRTTVIKEVHWHWKQPFLGSVSEFNTHLLYGGRSRFCDALHNLGASFLRPRKQNHKYKNRHETSGRVR